ncbi:MBL fold metallo-hydrolase [Gilvimarinus sp. F26214L]|uniref:MBL fold metallo-hydrolase n=1 Tax=Gilvimarinus sp. DZF01 TaxID=3461371 RepID=UPI0040465C7E
MTYTNESKPDVVPFFDEDTNTFSYVVKDPASSSCAVVDSVLNLDYPSGTISYTGADAIIDYVREHNLTVEWLIETHVHADHLSAAPYIQEKLGGKLGIGEHIAAVQETFGKVFNEGTEFQRDGSQFDHLFKDGEMYHVGQLECTAIHTPGHTPACMTHLLGDAAFVGDTLFMPDAGTARADFPGGDAGTLFDSIQKILSLPEETRIFMCHDYCPNGRKLEYETTVGEEKARNIHVKTGTSKSEFVEMREARDSTLGMPRLILPSLQVNMRAGHLPEPKDNGRVYLKVPINAFK